MDPSNETLKVTSDSHHGDRGRGLRLTAPTTPAETLFKLAAGRGPIALKANREIARRRLAGLCAATGDDRVLRLARAM